MTRDAIDLRWDWSFRRVVNGIVEAKFSTLEEFFAAKTHNAFIPFRAIVSEKGTWQLHISWFLQKGLRDLQVEDAYLIKNSEPLLTFLRSSPK